MVHLEIARAKLENMEAFSLLSCLPETDKTRKAAVEGNRKEQRNQRRVWF